MLHGASGLPAWCVQPGGCEAAACLALSWEGWDACVAGGGW